MIPGAPLGRHGEEALDEERLLLATATAHPAEFKDMRWLLPDDFALPLHATLWQCLTAVGSVDCDEFAMASTHESGGYPKSVNLVTSGSQCAQLFTDKMGDGSTNFGILADTRTATNGPSGTERCGRAAIPSVQNQRAFSGFPAPSWRMLDGDGFFLTLPGFEHCTSTATTCTWSKIG